MSEKAVGESDRTSALKVLFVIDSLGAGGAERSTALLAPALRARGVETQIVLLRSEPEGFESETVAAGVPVRVIDGGFVAQVRQLRAILKRDPPDVVHSVLYAADQVTRFAALGLSVKVVSSFVNVPRSTHPELADPARPTGPKWKRRVVDVIDVVTCHLLVDRFHAVSEGVAAEHRRVYRLPARRFSIVERGRRSYGDGDLSSRSEVREALGLRTDAFVVLCVGRLEHVKAHVDVVKAISALGVSRSRLRLLIAGREGDASEAVRAALLSSPEAADRTMLLGHRQDVPDLLAAADALVVSSRVEGTAGAALEAMSVATPVVSARLAGLEGILVDEENALLYESGDVPGLMAALERLMDDPALAGLLGAAGLRSFEQRFTLDRSVERMIAMYSEVVSASRRADSSR